MKTFTYNYEGFDPEANGTQSFPPVGEYTLQLLSVTGMNKGHNGYEKVVGEPHGVPDAVSAEFQVSGGNYDKTKFSMWYNVGHSNAQTSQIAFETIGKIYWAATGQKPDRSGLDITKAFFKSFTANLVQSKDKSGQLTKDKNGNPYHELRAFKPLAAGSAVASTPATEPVPNNDIPWNS